MAITEIRELRDQNTGKRIYPLTHAEAVIGLKDSQFFEAYTLQDGSISVRLKESYAGLWANGFISAGGLNSNSGGGGGGASSLSELSDVQLSSPSNGQALVYDIAIGKWKNANVSGGGGVSYLRELLDVYHNANNILRANGDPISNGDILAYDSANARWYAKAENQSGGSGTLTKVTVTGTNGISISGSPLNSDDEAIVVGINSNYKLPTTSEWNAKVDATSLSAVATTGSYNDLDDRPTIPAVAQSTGQSTILVMSQKAVTDAIGAAGGGTITGIRMNGAMVGTTGVVDLGTVITAHQSLAGYALDNSVVHKDGTEVIPGNKTFSGEVTFASLGKIFISGSDNYLSSILNSYQPRLNTGSFLSIRGIELGDQDEAITVQSWAAVMSTGDGITLEDALSDPNRIAVDSTHRWVTDANISAWNAKQNAMTAGVDYVVPSTLQSYLTTASAASTYLPLTGGTLTGSLTLSSGHLTIAKGNMIKFDESGNYNLKVGSGSDPCFYFHNGGTGIAGHPIYFETSNLYSYGSVTPVGTNGVFPSLGASNAIWGHIYVNRWYPTSDSSIYIEFDSANRSFKIVGNVYATGQVAAGGIISNN